MALKTRSETQEPADHLVQLALAGGQDALERLFASFLSPLYKVALGVVRSPQDAEDALQDGLLAALRNLKQFEGRSRFSTWLTRIVVNASLMQMRRKRSQLAMSIEDAPPQSDGLPFAARIADSSPNPEQLSMRSERLQILRVALQNTPGESSSAFWLRDVAGLSIRETAEVLGLSEGCVKSRLHRNRRRIIKEARRVLALRGFPKQVPRDAGPIERPV